jgi:hypothetical protein
MKGNYIKAVPKRTTSQLIKTSQTVSYRTGDDGDLERGRSTSFTVLAENNPFGNTNRFTDELGTQTYTKNIVIDWSTYDGSTVLGWRRSPVSGGTWNVSIDQSLLVSIAPFTTGWRLPNIREALNLINYSKINGLNNSPFLSFGAGIWTSTTSPATTTSAYWIYNYYNTYIEQTKTISTNWIPCRTFSVNGANLT